MLVNSQRTGSFFQTWQDARQRFTVGSQATIFGGNFWGMSHEFRIGFRHAIDQLFRSVDALVTPTIPVNAMPLSPAGDTPLDDATISLLTFTWLWNFCGAPAVSVPWGLDADGLPNSVQLIAAPGADPTAIAVATTAEAAAPDLPAPPST